MNPPDKPDAISSGLLAALLALTEEERCAAYVEINCWDWPECLAVLKPGNWDGMDEVGKKDHPSWIALWEVIRQCTSEFGRSRAWWVLHMKETAEAHLAWWNNGKRRPDVHL